MPEQSPISPPYKTACLLKKQGILDKASYSNLGATATANITSKKDSNVDSQTNDSSDVIQVEQLSLDEGETTTSKNEQI